MAAQFRFRSPPLGPRPGGEGSPAGPGRQALQPGLERAIHRAEKPLPIGHHQRHRLGVQRRQFRQAALGAEAVGTMAEAGLPLEALPLRQQPFLPQPFQPGPQLAGLLVGQALLIQQKQIAEPLAPLAVLGAEPAALPQALFHGGAAIKVSRWQALPKVERPPDPQPLRQGQQVGFDHLQGKVMQLGIGAAGQALQHQPRLAPPPQAHGPLHRRQGQQQAQGQQQGEIGWQ